MNQNDQEFAKDFNELKAWEISEEEFPSAGSNKDKLKFFINYAILAPSGHNTQPWLFDVYNNIIAMYADRTRALPVVDPEDRELTISCGAALSHLLLAIRHFGYDYNLRILPTVQGKEDLLAQVIIENIDSQPVAFSLKQGKEESVENLLFESIAKRRTTRMRFLNRKVPESILSKLQSIVVSDESSTDVWLHIAEESDERGMLAELVAQGDRIQMADKRFRRELSSWFHPNRSHSKDGIPGYAFGYSDMMSLAGPLVIRTFDMGKGRAAKDKDLAEESPVLAILGSKADKPSSWLRTGMVLAKILLFARSEGISCSFLNQPIEVNELRSKVKEVIKAEEEGHPQLLMRMGYGKEVTPTPRRSVKEVLLSLS